MAEIVLTRKNGDVYTVLVDDEDLERVRAAGPWYVFSVSKSNHYPYVKAYVPNKRGSVIYLHRLITNAEPGQIVDHINRDGLDNRRANLRLCSRSQNNGNRHRNQNNTSGFKGVSWCQKRRAWTACISRDSRTLHLGSFETPEEAHSAYCSAALEYFGDFARFK